jgi:hypothetical protein
MKTLLFVNQLHGFKVLASDGVIGHIDEFYFDDLSWKVRYCVVDLGNWITDRKVLISPAALGKLDWNNKGLSIGATKDQIQKSPDATAELPVARSLEVRIHQHYGWEYFWPEIFPAQKVPSKEQVSAQHDPHLRSTKVLTGISVGSDLGGDFGVIHDFLIDCASWKIEFAEVNHSKAGRMLLNTEIVRNIDVTIRKIVVASPW